MTESEAIWQRQAELQTELVLAAQSLKPGPWIGGDMDPGEASISEIQCGRLNEVGLIADDGAPQGRGLFRALTTSRWGELATMAFIGCSDDYYAWWMDQQPSQIMDYHVCLP